MAPYLAGRALLSLLVFQEFVAPYLAGRALLSLLVFQEFVAPYLAGRAYYTEKNWSKLVESMELAVKLYLQVYRIQDTCYRIQDTVPRSKI